MMFQVSPPWTDSLAASLPRACSNVCLYMDDVRPGNQHRPDKGRLYYAWYYQLVDLPYWFRVSAQGWFDLCFVKASDCEDIVGGFGCLTDRLLSMINFPFTVDVPSPGFASESSRGSARESSRGSAPRGTYEFKCHSFMADMKALQQMLGLKPSGAYKCCGRCANIIGRTRPGVYGRGDFSLGRPLPAWPFRSWLCAHWPHPRRRRPH